MDCEHERFLPFGQYAAIGVDHANCARKNDQYGFAMTALRPRCLSSVSPRNHLLRTALQPSLLVLQKNSHFALLYLPLIIHRFVNAVAGPGGKRRMNPNGENKQ